MIKFRRAAEIAVATVLFAGLSGTVMAQGAAADQIAARIAYMKSVTANLGVVRTSATATPANMTAAKAAAVKIADGAKKFPSQFPKGSDATAGKTRAKAEIWTDAAGWKAANDKSIAAANALVTATGGSDPAAVTAALTALQGTCGSCHGAYRGPAAT